MEHREVKFPANLINIRVQANSSYQIGRILDIVESEKGLTLMSKSEIKTNRSAGPRLRLFATFKDLKSEKKTRQKQKKYNGNSNELISSK
ncbi:MAG: hypothetical protein IKP88_17810 [Lachnospiraceae bacterium]|nr:hypothetical protein [Lachnospiraceae bacterium]